MDPQTNLNPLNQSQTPSLPEVPVSPDVPEPANPVINPAASAAASAVAGNMGTANTEMSGVNMPGVGGSNDLGGMEMPTTDELEAAAVSELGGTSMDGGQSVTAPMGSQADMSAINGAGSMGSAMNMGNESGMNGASVEASASQPNVASGYDPATLGATDPIMMPTPPKMPDPVEEELKAPLRAADPVPGSIGSAVSGQPKTPNVAFNDPATMNGQTNTMAASSLPQKKKVNKKTWILLSVVAGIIIVALVAILIIEINRRG